MNNELVVGKIEFGRTPREPRMFDAVDFAINDAVSLKMYKALSVIALDPKIQEYLKLNDLQALNQVLNSIEEYKASYQKSNL
jgi:hypothetical protein